MKTKQKKAKVDRKLIKVQLDHCTYATISRLSSLEVWQKKYPDAKIVT